MAFGDRSAPATVGKTALGYGVMVAGSVLAFLALRAQRRGIHAPAPSGASSFATAHSASHVDSLLHVLLALLVILVVWWS